MCVFTSASLNTVYPLCAFCCLSTPNLPPFSGTHPAPWLLPIISASSITHLFTYCFTIFTLHQTYFQPSIDDDSIPGLVGIAWRRRVGPQVIADARVDEGQCADGQDKGEEEEEDGVGAGAGVTPRLDALVECAVVEAKRPGVHVGVQRRADGDAHSPNDHHQADLVGAQPGHRVERVENGKVSAVVKNSPRFGVMFIYV